MYLTKEEKNKIIYSGKRIDEETEKSMEIIMEDRHTKKEAVAYLCNGTIIYEKEEFGKFFEQYMGEWDCDEEERAEYKKMIENNKPVFDWGIVNYENKTYFIDYVL